MNVQYDKIYNAITFILQVSMPSFPVVVKIGHAHSGIGKVKTFFFVQY